MLSFLFVFEFYCVELNFYVWTWDLLCVKKRHPLIYVVIDSKNNKQITHLFWWTVSSPSALTCWRELLAPCTHYAAPSSCYCCSGSQRTICRTRCPRPRFCCACQWSTSCWRWACVSSSCPTSHLTTKWKRAGSFWAPCQCPWTCPCAACSEQIRDCCSLAQRWSIMWKMVRLRLRLTFLKIND